jgi:anthranilate phosphoribosyltransferase
MGAFWMLIRIREETIAEAAGFTRSIRNKLSAQISIDLDLDWPAYAGKRNELPWFLLTAIALSQSGIKIFMHGHSFPEENRIYVDQALQFLGIKQANSFEQAQTQIQAHNFSYLALDKISNQLTDLMELKRLLGLRSPVNTLVRLMNPMAAKHSVHGVFHKGYDEIHVEAAKALGDKSVLVFRGGNGEAEVNPERDVSLAFLKESQVSWSQWPKSSQLHIRQKDNLDLTRLLDHWSGDSTDSFGGQAIIQTMASVLAMIRGDLDQDANVEQANIIWEQRDKTVFNRA